MDVTKVDTAGEAASHVRSAIWRQTVLTGCVLAACLAVIAVLVVF
jgi:hypothetical protein